MARASSMHMMSSWEVKKHILLVWEFDLKWSLVTYLHLKMARKSRNPQQVAWPEMSQPIRRENGDVMEMKTRLDDVIRGIKALDAVIFLIPSPAVEEATT